MRKIDLTNYNVDDVSINVVENLEQLIFGTDGLTGPILLERAALVEKIKRAGATVLLEEADFKVVFDLVTKSTVFNKGFVELVKRVLEAPEVDVKEN